MKIEGSSHIARAEYVSQDRMLVVGFHNGATHSYQNVSPAKWEAFQKAESKGAYLASEIKDKHRSWPAKDYKWAEP